MWNKIVAWARRTFVFPPIEPPVTTDYLAPCVRPEGDPLRKRHFFGRADGRTSTCFRCGALNPRHSRSVK